MLTYPRFAKACYALFAVAVLAAVLKLSISGAEPALLKMLPAAPTASAVEHAQTRPQDLEDTRLGSFSDAGETEKLEADLSRAASREAVLEGSNESSYQGSNAPPGDASVFRRPSLGRESASEPVCGDLGDAPRGSRVVFPLPEDYFDSYDDTWGAARPQGGHEGSDLMSPAGTPEFALTDGRLVPVAGSNENGWNTLGGYTVMLEAAYDVGPVKKGDLFYYAHMDRESSLPVGTEVRAGQRIGTVGDTGEGQEVTRGKFPPHLHLGWYDANLSKERSEAESGAMNPYPLLLWLERNGGAVSGGTHASYCQAPQSPSLTPSTGEPDWPTPSAPGQRPDLDTGSEGSASPVIKAKKPHGDHPEGDDAKDRGDGEKRGENENQEAKDGGEAPEAGEPEKARKKAMKLSLRKKIEAKMDTLLRDLPNLEFDRTTPKNRDGGEQHGKKKGDGRKDGEAGGALGGDPGKEREEGRQETERPPEDRPEVDRAVPPKAAPRPPAPVNPDPDRGQRPDPEETGKDPVAVEEPEAVTPPEAGRGHPAKKPQPLPDATTNVHAESGATAGGATAPVRGEAQPGLAGGTGPPVEPNDIGGEG